MISIILTTHEFEFDNAKDAFDLVVSKAEPFTGIALKYNTEKKLIKRKLQPLKSEQLGKINISFIGAGSYAQGNLLPNIPETNDVGRSRCAYQYRYHL